MVGESGKVLVEEQVDGVRRGDGNRGCGTIKSRDCRMYSPGEVLGITVGNLEMDAIFSSKDTCRWRVGSEFWRGRLNAERLGTNNGVQLTGEVGGAFECEGEVGLREPKIPSK